LEKLAPTFDGRTLRRLESPKNDYQSGVKVGKGTEGLRKGLLFPAKILGTCSFPCTLPQIFDPAARRICLKRQGFGSSSHLPITNLYILTCQANFMTLN